MLDILSIVASMQRPRLLVEAARLASSGYDRAKSLPRLTGEQTVIRSGEAILRLLEAESVQEDRRRSGKAGHSARRHVELLAAILAEAELLREATKLRLVA